ncbi:MAG: glycosyltransferase family 4 protein [Alphaproteobacteria bacterium]
MVRLENSGALLEIASPDDNTSGALQFHLWAFGGLLAYPIICARAVRQVLDSRRNAWRSAGTAIRLLLSAQFLEVGKRVLRKSGNLSPARNNAAQRAEMAIRSRRNHRRCDGPLRTVVFTHSLNLDGAPISQFELTVALSKQGVIVPIVVAPKDGPLRRLYEAESVEVRIQDAGPNTTDRKTAYDRAVSECATFFSSLSPDFLYANSAASFFAVDAADAQHLPCIWNLRESDPPETQFGDYSQSARKRALECLSLADQIVFVSEASRKVWQPLPENCRAMVIPNALDPDRLTESMSRWTREAARESLGIAPNEISIICVGTLCERKGQNDIVGAIERLPGDLNRRLRIDLIGRCGDRYGHDIRETIDAMPPRHKGRIRIFDATVDVARHYQAADIFICSSRAESYPRVILEAMAFRLAIATTPVFGISEQLTDGETALFYAPGDTAQLARHIHRFANDETCRRQFGTQAHASLDRLMRFPDMVNRYADIFREICVGDSIQP